MSRNGSIMGMSVKRLLSLGPSLDPQLPLYYIYIREEHSNIEERRPRF
jgi:hypothetical protein